MNETNYAYLAGHLEAVIKNFAYELQMRNIVEREAGEKIEELAQEFIDRAKKREREYTQHGR